MYSSEIIIIGGGMVGISIAYQIIERNISKNILIIDKEDSLGLHTSGRNSGVLHAGIYYKPGSLKAKVCIEGSKRLKKWIKSRCSFIFMAKTQPFNDIKRCFYS